MRNTGYFDEVVRIIQWRFPIEKRPFPKDDTGQPQRQPRQKKANPVLEEVGIFDAYDKKPKSTMHGPNGKVERDDVPPLADDHKVYVRGFGEEAESSRLWTWVKQKLQTCLPLCVDVVQRDGKPAGFGFMLFNIAQTAKTAIGVLNANGGLKFQGSALIAAPYTPGTGKGKAKGKGKGGKGKGKGKGEAKGKKGFGKGGAPTGAAPQP